MVFEILVMRAMEPAVGNIIVDREYYRDQ